VAVVVAHRTCPLDAAENSLGGVAIAASFDADFVEIDVRRTFDGTLVLLHDPWLLRTTWWPGPVRLLPAPIVTRCRLRGGGGQSVPRLSDVLAALPSGLGAAIHVKDAGAMAPVIAMARSLGCLERTLLWSEHERAIEVAVRDAPEAEAALLRDTKGEESTRLYLGDAVRLGARSVSLHQDSLSIDVVIDAHARGLRVYCWVQVLDRIASALSTGIDGIVSDWPVEARAAIGG
jgi:glycerophosphoryl diester phosphodiesterase